MSIRGVTIRSTTHAGLDRLLNVRVAVNVEVAIYVALFALAFALRFWDLGARALHHDESIHAQWSWDLLRGNYRHSPIFHGPLYYHVQGLVFFVFGASDYTARVSAAMFGSAMVLTPLLLRRRLGVAGTIAAVALIAFSPTLVYYSRFFREDIYVALFALLQVVAIWRYLDEGRARWLVLLGAAFTGAVLTKEGAFITAAVFLVAIDLHVAADFARQTLSARDRALAAELRAEHTARNDGTPFVFEPVFDVPWRRFFVTAFYAPYAWLVAAFWPFLQPLRQKLEWSELPRSADVLIVQGTLILPLLTPVTRHYLLEPLGILHDDRLRWETKLQGTIGTRDQLALLGLFAITTSGAAFVGLQWRPRLWSILFAACAVVYLTLMTSFWTNMNGLVSGPWGSLDYWITQQEVARGDQPWFYYYMVMPAYEFLPLALVLGGAWWATVRGDAFSRFLAAWLVGQWLALSLASEKMPWNNVHIALPCIMLAAWIVGRAFQGAGPVLERRGTLLTFASVAVTAAGAVAIIAYLPGGAGSLVARIAVAAVAAGLIAYTVRPLGRPALPAALVIATVGALAFFSVRTMLLAVYERGDVPKDLLVYTQSAPDIAQIASDIDRLAAVTGLGYDLPIAVDSSESFAWPWAWYLRDYRRVTYTDFSTSIPQGEFAVVLVNNANAARFNDHLLATNETRLAAPQRYPHRWWFDERYKTAMAVGNGGICTGLAGNCGPYRLATWKRMAEGVFEEGWWKTWLLFWRDHDPDAITGAAGDRRCDSCGSVDAWAYFPANFDRARGTLSVEPVTIPVPGRDSEGRLMFGGIGSQPGLFFSPVDVEADAAGNLYVIDSGSRRLQKFDANGNFIARVDIRVNQGDPNEQSQPWGLAIGKNGEVIVLDTFGWRVRVFTSDLQPAGIDFGEPPDGTSPPPPTQLFGPRDAIVDGVGNIWLTDTGHDRVLVFDARGEFVRQVGGPGNGPGQFDEPVGLALGPDGTVYVADMYNRRVQLLDREGRYVGEFGVEGWGGQEVTDKPYIEVLGDGRIAVGLPSLNVVRIYDRAGKVLGTINPTGEPLSRPYGMAETADGKLWIVEGGNGRLRLFDIP